MTLFWRIFHITGLRRTIPRFHIWCADRHCYCCKWSWTNTKNIYTYFHEQIEVTFWFVQQYSNPSGLPNSNFPFIKIAYSMKYEIVEIVRSLSGTRACITGKPVEPVHLLGQTTNVFYCLKDKNVQQKCTQEAHMNQHRITRAKLSTNLSRERKKKCILADKRRHFFIHSSIEPMLENVVDPNVWPSGSLLWTD